MKIIGFSQLRNELSNGNLLNWLRCMDMCEYIYIFDQNSDDGSQEAYKQNDKCVVIESPVNNFIHENTCKAVLLNKLLLEHPDADWIFWMDGDYLLDGRYLKDDFKLFYEICENAAEQEIDGIAFGHYNLWRSDIHYRVDDEYHSSHDSGRVSLWRNNKKLSINTYPGLHKSPVPMGIETVARVDCNLVHRGFATDYQIISKYDNYKSFGQTGWALERILDEETLETEVLDEAYLPEWFIATDRDDPQHKQKIREIYLTRKE